jgi:hypothetical protein
MNKCIHIISLLGLALLGAEEVGAVTGPSRSWDFRGCSSSTVMDSVTNLWATMQGAAFCTADGVSMNGDTSTFIQVESFAWDGTSGASFEVREKRDQDES